MPHGVVDQKEVKVRATNASASANNSWNIDQMAVALPLCGKMNIRHGPDGLQKVMLLVMAGRNFM